MHYTYMLKCKDDTYYTGYTNDLEKRFKAHNEGKGQNIRKAGDRWSWFIMKSMKISILPCVGNGRLNSFHEVKKSLCRQNGKSIELLKEEKNGLSRR